MRGAEAPEMPCCRTCPPGRTRWHPPQSWCALHPDISLRPKPATAAQSAPRRLRGPTRPGLSPLACRPLHVLWLGHAAHPLTPQSFLRPQPSAWQDGEAGGRGEGRGRRPAPRQSTAHAARTRGASGKHWRASQKRSRRRSGWAGRGGTPVPPRPAMCSEPRAPALAVLASSNFPQPVVLGTPRQPQSMSSKQPFTTPEAGPCPPLCSTPLQSLPGKTLLLPHLLVCSPHPTAERTTSHSPSRTQHPALPRAHSGHLIKVAVPRARPLPACLHSVQQALMWLTEATSD